MKKILALTLVLGLVSSSFAVYEGFEDYAVGTSVNGQGTATGGWAGAWTVTHPSNPITYEYSVAAGGSDDDPVQHMDMTGLLSGAYNCYRNIDTISGSWTFGVDLKLVGDENQTRDETRIELRDASGAVGMQIKIGPTAFEMFQLNDTWMNTQFPDGAYPGMKPLHETTADYESMWVSILVEYDAIANTFQLYWENLDGSMVAHNVGQSPDDPAWDGTISQLMMYGCKTYNGADSGKGLLVDNININAVPEPITLSLMGLGGLALLRRKR